MKKESNFLNEMESTFTYRRLFILFVLVLLFFAKQDLIISFIERSLFVSSSFSNVSIDVLVIVFSISLSVYFFQLVFKKNYKASYIQLISAWTIITITMYYYFLRDSLNWNFLVLCFFEIEYIWVLIFPLFVFLTSYYTRLIFLKNKRSTRRILAEDQLVQDNPINDDTEDALNYFPIVEKLHRILLSQESEKSMAIGLVGPWGNGKSSVISMLKSRLVPKQKIIDRIKDSFRHEDKDDYLIIHFLPYLNHNAEDLISEFFRSLSTALKPYNGKLSNLIIEYSNRLIDVYRKKVNVSFFDKHISSFEKTSAKEMYDDINERLKETNKRIIVFVDDLDRLNSKEILQVLKLIRNSADFRNIVFLVAMDKEYIVEILTKKGEIFSSRFIDKFFQLEVYLPAIRQDILKSLFHQKLKEKSINFSETFNKNLQSSIDDRYNLFDDYIKNIRDVKRTVNQIIYDYQFVEDAIDLKDFLNFIYFKMKFPKLIKIIIDNREEILTNPYNSKLFELKEERVEGTPLQRATFWWGNTDYNYEDLKKYKFYKNLFPEKDETEYSKGLTENERKLLMKTLSFLFGTDNKVSSQTSIKKEANFMMLMQQRIFESHLNNEEYEELIKLKDNELKSKISHLFKEGKLPQLLDRFDFIAPNTIEEARAIVEILAYIYDGRLEFKIYDSTIFKKLASQIDNYFKNNQGKEIKEKFAEIIKLYLFENENLNFASKLFLITELWKERLYNSLWEIGEEYVETNALILYKKYLDHHQNNLWEVYNYEFYHIGNNLRKIDGIKQEVIELSIGFWNEKDIELLCAQEVNIEPWTFKAFIINENVSEVFGSRDAFIDYIKAHKNAESPIMNEFIYFFELCQRTNYSKKILFTFEESTMMRRKIEIRKLESNSNSEDFKNSKQLFFETNDRRISINARDAAQVFSTSKHGEVQVFENMGTATIFIQFDNGYIKEEVEAFARKLVENASELGYSTNTSLDLNKLWRNNNFMNDAKDVYIKLISNQPKD